MVSRLALFRALVALALLAFVLAFAAGDTSAPARGQLEMTQPAGTVTVAPVSKHLPRPLPLSAVFTGLVLVAMAAVLGASRYGLVGRHQRRIDDIGDDWRSLLLGAPPVLAPAQPRPHPIAPGPTRRPLPGGQP